MTNAITQFEANGKLVDITPQDIKNYIAKGSATVTDEDVTIFLNLCKYQGLNPWLNEAYLVKYDSKAPAQIVVGKEAYMKRAQAQPDFDRIEAGIIIERDGKLLEVDGAFKMPKDLLLGGWAKVYRKGSESPMTMKVSVAEYSTGKSLWISKSCTMIRKVAIVQALRELYPDQLGSMYIEEEARREIEEVPRETAPKTKSFSKKANRQMLPGQKAKDIEIVELGADDIEEVQNTKASKAQIAALFDFTRSTGISDEDVKAQMQELFGKSKTAELTEEDVNHLIEWAADKAKDIPSEFLGDDFQPLDESEI